MKKNLFNSVSVPVPKKNVFDLSHVRLTSGKFGFLYPILVREVIPGDKFRIGGKCAMRLAPMIAPIMHRIDMYLHYWYVPNRILWPGWEKWISGDPTAAAFPYITANVANGCTVGSLWDHMGIPPAAGGNSENVNALPFAAVQAIWSEFYRDQNLQTASNYTLINGDNSANADLWTPRRRAWEHDYFTSCLPFAQKGAAVNLPLGTFKDVGLRIDSTFIPGTDTGVALTGTTFPGGTPSAPGVEEGTPDFQDPTEDAILYAKTSDLVVGATTITDLRRAFKLQEWLELLGRVGSRYKEFLRGMFGVTSQDSRLDLPEYITGIKSAINISEVLNTTGDAGTGLPQGNMAGHGIGVADGQYGSYYIPEHGFIIGLLSTRPRSMYQQGIERQFTKITDPYDYFFSQFEHIGEQAVLKREVYAFNGSTYGNETFGYNPRYSEYKFINSSVAGDFRSNLDFWHLGRIFGTPPALNADFIACDPDDSRIFAAGGIDDYLWCQVVNDIRAIRGMAVYGSPSM